MIEVGNDVISHGGIIAGGNSSITFHVAKARVDYSILEELLRSKDPVTFVICD